MASKLTTKTASSPSFTPTTPPISLLPDPLAKQYAYLHGPIVLGFYILRFPSLVADPVSTMLDSIPFVALLQLTFCVLCLAPAGTTSTGPVAGNTKSAGGSLRRKPYGYGGVKGGKELSASTNWGNKLIVGCETRLLRLLGQTDEDL